MLGITTRSGWFSRLGPEIIRGQLYGRILDHIRAEDHRVRELVHPGMVLRRLTPEIIREVLAPVCDVQIADEDDAERLFEQLRREHTLVRYEDDGSIRYRDDIRRPVLQMVMADQPELTREAHLRAIDYYADRCDPISRAEHVYHSLMAGQKPQSLRLQTVGQGGTIDPEVRRNLTPAMDEVPPAGKLYLAAELGLQISDELRQDAETADWERIIGQEALRYLSSDGSGQVLELLHERPERTPESPLLAIEARCYLSLGQYVEAREFLRQSLSEYPVHGNQGRRSELTWLLAQVDLQSGAPDDGKESLRELITLTRSLITPVPRIQSLATLIDNLDPTEQERGVRQAELRGALLQVSAKQFYRNPDVVRYGFSRIQRHSAGRLPNIASLVTSDIYNARNRQNFEITDKIVDGLLDLFESLENRALPMRDAPRANVLTGEHAHQLAFISNKGVKLLSDPSTARDHFQLNSMFRSVLTDEKSSALASEAASTGTWWLTQGFRGSFASSTLSGLEPYRDAWEFDEAFQAEAV